MINLLKIIGKGLLYIISFPFFIIALIIFGAVGVFLFIFQLVKSIFFFFTGRKFFPELPEDKELRLMKEKAAAANNPDAQTEQAPVEQPAKTEQPVTNNQETVVTPIVSNDVPVQEEKAPQPVNRGPLNLEAALFTDLSKDILEIRTDKPVEEAGETKVSEPSNSNGEEVKAETPKAEEPKVEAPKRDTTQDELIINQIRDALGNNPNMQPNKTETPAENKEKGLEEYVPEGTTYYDDSDEEDTNEGVHIDYDL